MKIRNLGFKLANDHSLRMNSTGNSSCTVALGNSVGAVWDRLYNFDLSMFAGLQMCGFIYTDGVKRLQSDGLETISQREIADFCIPKFIFVIHDVAFFEELSVRRVV
jgi:hypothetical protein